MTIPKDLAKKRDEYLSNEISSSSKCCEDCALLCKRVSSENGYAVRAFNAGVLAALSSEHVLALVEALENAETDFCVLEQYEKAKVITEALDKWGKRNE